MRWPFWRRDNTEDALPTSVEAPSVEAPAVDAASAASAAVPAWRSLPPLQRAVSTDAPLTAPTDGIRGDVADRLAPSTALEPLGHNVGALAPHGTIGLTGSPIAAADRGPELVGRPAPDALSAQRSPSRVAESPAPAAGEAESSPALLPAPAIHHVPVVGGTSPQTAQRSLVSAEEPVGHPEPVSERTATDGEAVRSTPLPIAVQAAAAAPAAGPAAVQRTPVPAGAKDSIARPLGLGPPIRRSGGIPIQRAIVDSADARPPDGPAAGYRPSEAAIEPIRIQRLALDELPIGRPTGLGRSQPQAEVEVTGSAPPAAGQRAGAEPVPDPASPPTGPVFTGQVDVSRLATEIGRESGPRVPAQPEPARVGPVVQRLAVSTVIASTRAQPEPAPSAMGRGPGLDIQRTATARPRIDRPTSPAQPPGDASAGGAAVPGPVVGDDAEPHDLETRDPEPTVVLRRLVADSPRQDLRSDAMAGAPPSSGTASPRFAIQRSPVPTTASQAPIMAPAMPLAPVASSRPAIDGLISEATPVEVQRATVGDGGPGATALGNDWAAGPRPSEFAGSIAIDLPIQRQADDAPGSAPTPTATSTPGATPLASDKDLDELARRLYDRIRRRLSRELLTDRERAGLLTDLR